MWRFRIFLLTVALGLASTLFFGGIYEKWTEIFVELPQVRSDVPIYIFPRYFNKIPGGGGSGSGFSCHSIMSDEQLKQICKENKRISKSKR